jgi:hypothetical protein
MAEKSRSRLDAYGRPLAKLVEVRQDYYGHRLTNQAQRQQLLALLEEQWQVLLRKGIYGELSITVRIVDGIIQDQSGVSVTRHIRVPKEDARGTA